jgi:olefin beta-lactone synthetase
MNEMVSSINVGRLLSEFAAQIPEHVAIAEPNGRDATGRIRYRTVTFAELDRDSTRIAQALLAWGVQPGMKLVLMVPQSIDFIALVFALFKAGVVSVLIDPGMGRSNILRCLAEINPDGFVAIPLVHVLKAFMPGRFPRAKWNVTVGRRWLWRGMSLAKLRSSTWLTTVLPVTEANDPAAIIFTTGSTGPPKGVLYRHGNFWKQISEIRDHYGIAPGEIDVAGFPLFALFNAGMGVTTVIPQMDPTRPARVKPENIVDAVNQWQATQAFGSPALWNVVGSYCERTSALMPSLRRVLSAGAPVPEHVLRRMKHSIHPEGNMFTPYGATESLPVASISATEVLSETAMRTAQGAGTCVGRKFPGIDWKIIRICDTPLPTLNDVEVLPQGEIGEIMVRGDVVTREYFANDKANRLHKVRDGESVWHRIGDVGYLDEQDRFWFCGRKSHRVQTATQTMYTEPCEAILNQHPAVYRSALVGVGERGSQIPVAIVEPWPKSWTTNPTAQQALLQEVRWLAEMQPLTSSIEHFFLLQNMPVDIRHNAKIFREKLAVWAEQQLQK